MIGPHLAHKSEAGPVARNLADKSLAEIEINLLFAGTSGAVIIDALIHGFG